MKKGKLFLISIFFILLSYCTPFEKRDFYVVGKQYIREHTTYDVVELRNNVVEEKFILFVADSLSVVQIEVDKETYHFYNKGDKFKLKNNIPDILKNSNYYKKKR